MQSQTKRAQHTQERVGDQDEETLHGVHSLKLLEQSEIEKRVDLAVGDEKGLHLCPGLSVYLLDEGQLLRGDEFRALVSLREVSGAERSKDVRTSQGTGFDLIFAELSSR